MRLRSHLALLAASTLVPLALYVAVVAWSSNQRERTAQADGLQATARALSLAVDREVMAAFEALNALRSVVEAQNKNEREIYEEARAFLQGYTIFDAVTLVEQDGRVIFNTLLPFGTEIPPIPLSREYLSSIFAGQPRALAGRLNRSLVTNERILPIAVPVRKDGKVKYALAARFKLDRLGALFRQQQIPVPAGNSSADRRMRQAS